MEENLTPDFPIFCTSSLKDSVSPATAHLVAAYTANFGAPVIDDAEEILMNMSLKDLLKNSQYNSDRSEREIRFADAGDHFETLDKDDWEELKHNL